MTLQGVDVIRAMRDERWQPPVRRTTEPERIALLRSALRRRAWLRGVMQTLAIALAFVLFTLLARGAMADEPEPRCSKSALKAALAELWTPQPDWTEHAIQWTYNADCECGCCDGGEAVIRPFDWQETCEKSSTYLQCKADAALKREAAEEAERKAKAEQRERLDALARACGLPGFEPPPEPEPFVESWIPDTLRIGNEDCDLQIGYDGTLRCVVEADVGGAGSPGDSNPSRKER